MPDQLNSLTLEVQSIVRLLETPGTSFTAVCQMLSQFLLNGGFKDLQNRFDELGRIQICREIEKYFLLVPEEEHNRRYQIKLTLRKYREARGAVLNRCEVVEEFLYLLKSVRP